MENDELYGTENSDSLDTRLKNAKAGIEDSEFTLSDWKYDVTNGDTKLGYLAWVLHNIESHEGDK